MSLSNINYQGVFGHTVVPPTIVPVLTETNWTIVALFIAVIAVSIAFLCFLGLMVYQKLCTRRRDRMAFGNPNWDNAYGTLTSAPTVLSSWGHHVLVAGFPIEASATSAWCPQLDRTVGAEGRVLWVVLLLDP
ncbi:unnamed protein product [Allacma fusca]|uniref:Uncharacterized protein n=1 Tax=Allacma fusca TaxID=39272 RepID=A0A8J2J5H6_9HEXA|nr:unnamed protein product [Allacma fusca]